MTTPSLIWFRQDLRLADNPALSAAAKAGPVLALYVLDDSLPWPIGGASRWWLHHSLESLAAGLKKRGVDLVLLKGKASTVVPDFVRENKIEHVFWNRLYEPAAIARDTELKTTLKNRGVSVESFNGSLLFEPWTIKNQSGNPFKVFTPFSKACLTGAPPATPLPVPKMEGAKNNAASLTLNELKLLPTKPNWAKSFTPLWAIGEAAAEEKLHAFLEDSLAEYAKGRDRPDEDLTSRLSPHLHFGEISPRTVFYTTRHAESAAPALAKQAEKFISEILWREFSYHLLHAFPNLPQKPLNATYADFPWAKDDNLLHAWQRGQTGIPIVDAGMRQLWQTGWMHNRVRMVVASLLVKNMLHPWQDGAAWFWDCLVDADLAANSASWQWVAGCGADAAPYYRIFNPVLQGLKFDPNGDYVKKYVPELAKLPPELIHEPWKDAGAKPKNYPAPVVDLKSSRTRALNAYQTLRAAQQE